MLHFFKHIEQVFGQKPILSFSGVTISVSIVFGLLNIGISVPPEFQGASYISMGLFGNNDGDPTNDFVLSDGTTLPNNMTDREIFSYGENCKNFTCLMTS